jgi:inosine-uridine nucleoside N-ribohydrolase
MRSELEETLATHTSKALEMVRDISNYYMRYHLQVDGIDGCFMHDPLAVGVAINPDFISATDALVKVERRGEWTRGMTVSDLRPSRKSKHPNVKVAVEVNSRGFLDFFLKRLCK